MGRIKEWEELTIQDNFLFQKVMQNKRLCQRLIQKLLHIRVKDITYPDAEKTLETSPTQKGIRLDLYVETDEGTIIDIEMQTADKSLGWLPKRTRYYQAMIDLNVLGKGKEYIELKQSFVIFICTFDPFPGSNRKMYTFTNRCHEQDGLELGDETVKIFLNTKGTAGGHRQVPRLCRRQGGRGRVHAGCRRRGRAAETAQRNEGGVYDADDGTQRAKTRGLR